LLTLVLFFGNGSFYCALVYPHPIKSIFLQVPPGSAVAKAGLIPLGRGFAGNIVLGDVIVAVDGKPVSALLIKFPLLIFFI
jgi:hypothetical protein